MISVTFVINKFMVSLGIPYAHFQENISDVISWVKTNTEFFSSSIYELWPNAFQL